MEKAFKAVKIVGGLVITIGVSTVVANLIRVTTPETTNKIIKACVVVGSCIVAGMAADAASAQFENSVNKAVAIAKAFTQYDPKDGTETEA